MVALGVLTAVVVAGAADAERPVKVEVRNLVVTADGGFTPKALSKTKLTPVAFNASGRFETKDDLHPPAVEEVIVEGDKNVVVDTTGFPVCTSGKSHSLDTKRVRAICKRAIIGEGTTDISIAFPDWRGVPVSSKLLVVNGGTARGVTTFIVHGYITIPVPAAIVTTVKIKKIRKGRYGTLATALLPKIAGGSGAVTSFSLTINKKYTHKGKRMSVVSAKCPDGRIQTRATAKFSDGTSATAKMTRSCIQSAS